METNYVFPNQVEEPVLWGIMIVLYPFMTCSIFGGLAVSSLPALCGRRTLGSLSRLALAIALSFMPFAFLPILLHLGQPTRALNIMTTPRFSSPMAVFGFVFSAAAGAVVFMAWLIFRKDLLDRARACRGPLRLLYAILSLGHTEITPQAARIDAALVRVLRVIAILSVAILPGYVAFDFATCPGNPWWNTTIRPVLFLLTGVVNGAALTLLFASLFAPSLAPDAAVRTLLRFLGGTLALLAVLGILEIAELNFVEGYPTLIVQKLFGPDGALRSSFFLWQLGIGTALPLVLIVFALLARLRGVLLKLVAFAAGSLGLVQTMALLWNTVIGGQLVSKSFRGISTYTPPAGGREGLFVAAVILILPVITFLVIRLLVPLRPPDEEALPVS